MNVDWAIPEKPNGKVLIIWPGIGGDSTTCYVKYTCHHAVNRGYECAVIQGRGINAPLSTPEFCLIDRIDDWK